ncbi:polymorphic toxin-type HINT domain-containing protein, partial [Microcoleus sp. D2_18a_D3]|uniref:polymorphic toxin-type HINT domain-containing protein n=1 Tax=Microcoleus sp. D2_18a_D3 TaxID=3055330 RepID=UPI002FD29171
TKAGNCFVAGTEILTVDGIKNIEDIQVGDWVIADDPTTPGEIEARQVLNTFVRETDALVDLYVDGEVISTTGEHPFWVSDKGWVEAKDLVVGSLLQTADGRSIDVDKIEKQEGKFEVYNFSVEDFHTYFVSDWGILVHNAEYFYRTMSEKEYKKVVDTGGLSIREQGSSELGITREPAYLNDLGTRSKIQKQYQAQVEFEVEDGTYIGLVEMGATHSSAAGLFPGRPPFEKGMDVPQLKLERNEVVSILLGKSPNGVDFFNRNIIKIERLN